jgi:hypothetical protein
VQADNNKGNTSTHNGLRRNGRQGFKAFQQKFHFGLLALLRIAKYMGHLFLI